MIRVSTGWHKTGLLLGLRDLDVRQWTIYRSSAGQLRHFTCDENNNPCMRILKCECDMLFANTALKHSFTTS
ncbi:hypothetical protein F4678DRAFT_43067 [Xylaria arbuscula]|nr:hypothetical protein F4678DRAFT_43067 [Xylaria arbuscula]